MRVVGPRLGPMVTVSALVHVLTVGYLVVAVKPQPRIVYRPSYTVDLVDAPRTEARAAPAPPPAPPPPPPAAPAPPPPPPPPPAARPAPPPPPARSDTAELARQKAAEAEKLRLAELARQEAADAEKLRLAELERQKAAEAEKARQAELARQRAAEAEKARLAEAEKTRQVEAERLRQEAERQRVEAERQQRLAKLDEERTRIREDAERRRLDAERQERLARIAADRNRIREVAAQAAAARAAEEALQVKFQAYYDNAHRTIQALWIVPEWVRRRDVEVRVSLTVGRDGRILKTAIESRSGDSGLDQSVQNALEKARQAGLPPLPPEYKQDQLEFGLIFNPSKS